MEVINITTPLTTDMARQLQAGQLLLISGTIYTARDAAHKRLMGMLDRGEESPFPLKNQIVYYAGPTPPAPGAVVGSIGPTSGYRMDAFAPRLYKLGVTASMGKGGRSLEVVASLKQYGAVYLAAIGGLGALLSKHVTAVEMVAFEDLGTEAVRKLTVEKFPAIVAIDSKGVSVYERNSV
ncbi:MAG: FumA C-terminus/TtdB family hydratase beta subunit [Candidatus Auribacterota bacterium]|jgi:fumarate hydratase subunit beta|nr:FumA C-terminus/TtdB family hydratase beta subunit [Candidatus Auribacterota bacterium]